MQPDGKELLEQALNPPAPPAPPVDPIDTALSAVNTILGTSSMVLTVVGIALAVLAAVLALLALFGWFAIQNAAVKAAKEVAEKKLDSHLMSESFDQLLQGKIDEAVRERIQGMIVVQPALRNPNDPPAFPERNPQAV